VVSSGKNVQSVIDEFNSSIISYHHLERGGQIRQKIFAITQVGKNAEWVFFLDDDLELDSEMLQKFVDWEKNITTGVVGIGINVISKENAIKKSIPIHRISKSFIEKNQGKVHKSGQVFSYMKSRNLMEVEWINGASIWRRDITTRYSECFGFLESKYSIYEDVIFSYSQRSHGKLIYNPELKCVSESNQVADLKNAILVFRSRLAWKYYFVCQHKELSIYWMFISTIFDLYIDSRCLGLKNKMQFIILAVPQIVLLAYLNVRSESLNGVVARIVPKL
jgi:hypothetical protein